MSSRAPGGDNEPPGLYNGFDVHWINCSAGCGAIHQFNPNTNFYFTSCGHILCQKCKEAAGQACPACRQQLKIMPLKPSEDMPYGGYLRDQAEVLAKKFAQFMNENVMPLRNVLKFQRQQQRGFSKVNTMMVNKMKKLMMENAKLLSDMANLRNRYNTVEEKLKVAEEKIRQYKSQPVHPGSSSGNRTSAQGPGSLPRAVVAPGAIRSSPSVHQPVFQASAFITPAVPLSRSPNTTGVTRSNYFPQGYTNRFSSNLVTPVRNPIGQNGYSRGCGESAATPVAGFPQRPAQNLATAAAKSALACSNRWSLPSPVQRNWPTPSSVASSVRRYP